MEENWLQFDRSCNNLRQVNVPTTAICGHAEAYEKDSWEDKVHPFHAASTFSWVSRCACVKCRGCGGLDMWRDGGEFVFPYATMEQFV
jgi:hypothetical protein